MEYSQSLQRFPKIHNITAHTVIRASIPTALSLGPLVGTLMKP